MHIDNFLLNLILISFLQCKQKYKYSYKNDSDSQLKNITNKKIFYVFY